MPEPTIADIDALVGPATPQFAYQLRARVRELVLDLPEDDPVRRYGEEQMELLDRLGPAVVGRRGGAPPPGAAPPRGRRRGAPVTRGRGGVGGGSRAGPPGTSR